MNAQPPELPRLTFEAEQEAAAGIACRCGTRLGIQARRYHIFERGVHPQTMEPISVAAVVLTCGKQDCAVDRWARYVAVASEPSPPVTYLRDRSGPASGLTADVQETGPERAAGGGVLLDSTGAPQ